MLFPTRLALLLACVVASVSPPTAFAAETNDDKATSGLARLPGRDLSLSM